MYEWIDNGKQQQWNEGVNKMMRVLSRLVIGFSVLMSQTLWADVHIHTAQSAREIEQHLPKAKVLDKTWMVFDLDDTLLTMKSGLGGVGWWDWQAELIERNINSPLRAAKDMNGLIKVQQKLFATQPVDATDPYYQAMLKHAGHRGARVFALTARGEYFQAVTEQQLRKVAYTENEQLVFERYKPAVFSSFAHQKPFACPNMFKPLISKNGVMYLENQNKGDALVCILSQSKTRPDTLIFVDDSPRNIQAMAQALRKYPNIDAHLVLFTKEHAKEEAFKSSQKMQKQAALHWKKMQNAVA